MAEEHDWAIDIDEALAFTAGDREMLASMAEMFLEEGKKQLDAIKIHLNAGDLAKARKAAHALRGSTVIFAARQATEATLELERVATEEHVGLVPQAWATLEHEINRLFGDARRLIDSSQC